jgi:hypothetical protein
VGRRGCGSFVAGGGRLEVGIWERTKIHFRLKPHLTKVFRDLDVTSRPALTCVCDELLHRVDFSARVYRVPRSKKSEKRKNRVSKMTEIDQMGEKSPKNGKKDPVK